LVELLPVRLNLDVRILGVIGTRFWQVRLY